MANDALAIDLAAPCWLWRGTVRSDGYGAIQIHGEQWRAHRLMWVLMRGGIPNGMEIDHLCRTRACVNPQHMEVVTHRENCRRGSGWAGQHARKTHCPKGHAYDEANTYRRDTMRYCRQCHREAERQRYKQVRNRANGASA